MKLNHITAQTSSPTSTTIVPTSKPTPSPNTPKPTATTSSPTIHPNCTDEVTCSAAGTCKKDGTCDCIWGYVTHNPSQKNTYCNYQQKEQLIAFLLSMFLGGFAGGRWYIDDYPLAAIKTSLIFIGCCIGCICAAILGKTTKPERSAVGCFPVCLASTVVIIWCIVDIILFALNQIPDGNGVELAPWG